MQADCPFIVCMTYAFHTTDKLCFILDLMNGGDLHYHLSQHGVFNEVEMRFYAAEVILGKPKKILMMTIAMQINQKAFYTTKKIQNTYT